MTNDLIRLTLAEAKAGLRKKSFSAVELTQAYLDAMAQHRSLNVYILETPELALQAARESDARLAKGDDKPLDGIPLAIKDLFCTEGIQTTAGSHILEDFKPTYESTVTQNLKNAGAIFLVIIAAGKFQGVIAPTTPIGCLMTSKCWFVLLAGMTSP